MVFIAGLGLRVYNLGNEALGYGEVEVYQSAQEFLRGNFAHNFYIFAETPLLKYMFTFSLFLLKEPETGLRIVPVLFGSLAIILVFLFARKLYSNTVALFASLFTAFSIIHIELSRYAQFEAALSAYYIAVFYVFWKFLEERTNKNAIIMGAVAALGFLTKTMFMDAIIIILFFSVVYGVIKFGTRPSSFISVDNSFLKAVVIFVIVFLVVWPIALLPLKMHAVIDVEGRVNEINANVPTILLVLGYRFTETGKAITDNVFISLPAIGNFFFFLIKENLVFVVLFFLGLLAMHKNRNKRQDFYVLAITAGFFMLVWLHSVRYTYRYTAVIIPFLAIIAARSVYFLSLARKNKVTRYVEYAAFFLLFFVSLATAFAAQPDYPLHYNVLQNAFNVPPSEGLFNEGLRDVMNAVKPCEKILSNNFYKFTLEAYYGSRAAGNHTDADCAVKGTAMPSSDVDEYISEKGCTLSSTVEKKGVLLFEIYSC